MMMSDNDLNRCGVLPEATHQSGREPDPMPRMGPPQTTEGLQTVLLRTTPNDRRNLSETTGNSPNGNGNITDKNINIMQWNAEGVRNKKLALTKFLKDEDIDVACIQETHLNPEHAFRIRGYETLKLDREGHKGGVIILIRLNIPIHEVKVTTGQNAEILGADIYFKQTPIRLYNLYCPANKDLSLAHMEIKERNCIVLGDFNSHSERWGYNHTDARGGEVEDWEIDSNLHLINRADDPPTFYSRRWLSTSTPDLGFTTFDLAHKMERYVLPQLAGSDHKPIKLTLQLHNVPLTTKPLPRWNYKRADWNEFQTLTDKLCSINTHHKKITKMYNEFNTAVLAAAKATIPRGARRDYRPYWTEGLQKLEEEVCSAREAAEKEQTTAANIHLKEVSARLRRETNETARKSWKAKTESLNFEKDGTKLWKLARKMSDENCFAPAIVIEKDDHKCNGKEAADVFISTYHNISKLHIPEDRNLEMKAELQILQDTPTVPEANMMCPFTAAEFEKAVHSLKKNKSPGKDAITNEMIQHLGPKARMVFLKILNKSWMEGITPQTWKEAIMVPIHKKGKGKLDPHNYRPISLLSCAGKVMEKMVNNRLLWHLESKGLLTPDQAGFRQHRSTEDQVSYIAQEIEDAFQEKQQLVAVWVDLEKAFDKVWKEGLKLKLLRCGVTGHMYKWIDSFLSDRSARVHLQGHISRKLEIEQGVPQGGVLSPTLFLIYINDMVQKLPRRVHRALYADDLALWSTADSAATAGVRVQEALHTLETWTKDWLLRVNEKKTMFTVFSLSTKQKLPKLLWNGVPLSHDTTPTYLGITLDQRLTWTQQIHKCHTRAKLRLGLMRKLAGTSWGCDKNIL